MKKIAAMALAFIMVMAVACFAQEKTKPAAQADKKEMKTIFSYKSELGLSDKDIELSSSVWVPIRIKS